MSNTPLFNSIGSFLNVGVSNDEDKYFSSIFNTDGAPDLSFSDDDLNKMNEEEKGFVVLNHISEWLPWRRNEHSRFLEATMQIPIGDHDRIAAYIGTRNANEVKFHIQVWLSRGAPTTTNSVNTTSNLTPSLNFMNNSWNLMGMGFSGDSLNLFSHLSHSQTGVHVPLTNSQTGFNAIGTNLPIPSTNNNTTQHAHNSTLLGETTSDTIGNKVTPIEPRNSGELNRAEFFASASQTPTNNLSPTNQNFTPSPPTIPNINTPNTNTNNPNNPNTSVIFNNNHPSMISPTQTPEFTSLLVNMNNLSNNSAVPTVTTPTSFTSVFSSLSAASAASQLPNQTSEWSTADQVALNLLLEQFPLESYNGVPRCVLIAVRLPGGTHSPLEVAQKITTLRIKQNKERDTHSQSQSTPSTPPEKFQIGIPQERHTTPSPNVTPTSTPSNYIVSSPPFNFANTNDKISSSPPINDPNSRKRPLEEEITVIETDTQKRKTNSNVNSLPPPNSYVADPDLLQVSIPSTILSPTYAYIPKINPSSRTQIVLPLPSIPNPTNSHNSATNGQ